MRVTNKISLLVILLSCVFVQCGPTASRVLTTASYDEDLSIHREKIDRPMPVTENNVSDSVATEIKKVYPEPRNHIAYELDSVVNIIKDSRKNVTALDGYTIQIYSGNNREKANNVRWAAAKLINGVSPKISYEQPNYKVKMGKYFSRLEANKDYTVLRKEFSRAVLIPARISIVTE